MMEFFTWGTFCWHQRRPCMTKWASMCVASASVCDSYTWWLIFPAFRSCELNFLRQPISLLLSFYWHSTFSLIGFRIAPEPSGTSGFHLMNCSWEFVLSCNHVLPLFLDLVLSLAPFVICLRTHLIFYLPSLVFNFVLRLRTTTKKSRINSCQTVPHLGV